jgi:hypothetical protein
VNETPNFLKFNHLIDAVASADDESAARSATYNALVEAQTMFAFLTSKIDALETRAARRLEMIEEAVFSTPAPATAVVTVSGAAFNQSIELLELIARTSADELTVNRLGHAIRMLSGEEAPVPF